MTILRLHTASALLGIALLSGCFLKRGDITPAPSPHDDWSATLAQARQEILALRFGVADRVLTDFATRFPTTPEAFEVNYYRALFKLDPTNQTATLRDAEVLLDAYLAAPMPLAHRADAATLRRAATALERALLAVSAQPPAAPPSGASSAAPKTDEKSRDDELARLKDELAKANAELERIKRRVAQPKP